MDLSVHYPDPDCRALRQALADYENDGRRGMERDAIFTVGSEIRPEHMICGNGAAELMFALAGAYRPQRALLAVPSFYEYEQALEAFGCTICRYVLKAEQKFALDKDFLDTVARFVEETNPAIVILGNPNNPTGCLIERKVLRLLIELCREKQVLLVLDESFLDFLSEEDRTRTFSGVSVVPEVSNVFVIRSFTKIYALPGIRFGYGLCSDRKLLDEMRRLLQPWNVSLIAQEAARAAVSERGFVKESARPVAVNRGPRAGALRQAGYGVFPASANFLLFRGPEDLADFCMQRGFLIRDCSNFPGLERTGDGQAYFRVCVRSQAENEALLEVLCARM
ncbi:MAG: aminotransferase class I/II-fold pyridoxal phosphate-dependent enzyme [Clostridiales bacterium]|nr:aminotransferase class I/II-fold pyridoxal phosphate-dependent enzyme [Clostridiales bacterium]